MNRNKATHENSPVPTAAIPVPTDATYLQSLDIRKLFLYFCVALLLMRNLKQKHYVYRRRTFRLMYGKTFQETK
ncbi:hypothetical protein EZS27_018534 [termite gut metagenome]|uniref:Uncharacterized protein n=1 Tax=termite gut metagenome TaxID=433724 RepID=A0A5J4RIV2_9ZZZZ